MALTVIIIGLSGLVAQVLLLRELLAGFYGNELTLGIILANWLLLEACGTYFCGKYLKRKSNSTNTFLSLQILFLIALPFSLYLARSFKGFLGVPFGEGVGLAAVFYISFATLLPLGFSHGALFSATCKMQSERAKAHSGPISKIYALETVGTLLGGLIFTYLFIPHLGSFHIAFIISLLNLLACFIFFKYASKILKYIILVVLIAALFFSGQSAKFERVSSVKQFPGQELLDYRNSPYGNIAVTKKNEQYTFFYNGLPIITTPYPDLAFMQEFVSLPLLFHPQPKNILVIGGGAGGLINEMLSHPVSGIDYAELDPLLIDMLKEHRTPLTERELSDKRVNIIYKDGRYFINRAGRKYDVIFIGLSNTGDLSLNRLFTEEFFLAAKKRLNPQGIIVFHIAGSLTYLSRQLRDFNAYILNALKEAFPYARAIPGDYNIFIASDSVGIMEVSAQLITKRISERVLKTGILVPDYLDYRLSQKTREWFEHSLLGASAGINQDLIPVAVYQALIIWNRQFSPAFSFILESFKNINMAVIFIFIFILTCLLAYLSLRKREGLKLSVAYSIATTGFFGMLANLILIFSFQVAFGYLYHMLGLLTAIFMCGIALGALGMPSWAKKKGKELKIFLCLEGGVLVFCLLLAKLLTPLSRNPSYSWIAFISLFLFCGLLVGAEFASASRIYREQKAEVAETAGLLNAVDLLGGCLAGVLGGVVLLPLLGLVNSCLILAGLKISSLALILPHSKPALE